MSVRAIVALGEWTGEQGGMVTTSQAAAVGVDRGALFELVQAGALERVRQGVYRLTMAPTTPNDHIRAVWLQAEPGPLRPDQRLAAVCRQTAAELYGIGDLFPPAIQVTLPYRRRTNQRDVRFYLEPLVPDEVDWIDAIRVTRPARIIGDLLGDGYADLEYLGSIAVDAVMDRSLTPRELISACAPHALRLGLSSGDGEGLARWMWDGVTSTELRVACSVRSTPRPTLPLAPSTPRSKRGSVRHREATRTVGP